MSSFKLSAVLCACTLMVSSAFMVPSAFSTNRHMGRVTNSRTACSMKGSFADTMAAFEERRALKVAHRRESPRALPCIMNNLFLLLWNGRCFGLWLPWCAFSGACSHGLLLSIFSSDVAAFRFAGHRRSQEL